MGLSGDGKFCCFLFFWRHVGILLLPVLLEALGGYLLLLVIFGGTFWGTIFLVEGYLLFVFLSFGSFG